MKCPVCNNLAKKVFTIQGFIISQCECTHRFTLTDERHPYDDAYFFEGGVGYPNYLLQEEMITKHALQYAKMNPVGKLLDIGAAAGFIMQGFKSCGWEVQGIEPNKTMATYGKKLGLDIKTSSIENYETEEQFDLITLIQVIGHIHDLQGMVQKLKRWVKPNGHILVETWNWQSIPARILGKNWHEYSPPSVVQWFTPPSLNLLFKDFQVVGSGLPKKNIMGKHIKSLVREKYGIPLPIPEKIVFPYPSFDLFYTLFRRSE